MESLFSLYKDDIPDEQYEEYLETLEHAEKSILQQADIILCTCVTSAQLNISSVINIQQVTPWLLQTKTKPLLNCFAKQEVIHKMSLGLLQEVS